MATQDGTLDGGPAQTDGQPTGNPYIDALIWGAEWDISVEPITYYFEGASKDTQAFSASEKAAFVQIISNFEAVCKVTFTEVFTEAASDITWVKIPNDPDFVAYHDVPDELFPDPLYGIFTTSDGGWSNVDEQGSYFYNIVQHEIGHGLGLAHSHDGGEQDDATTFPGVTKNAGSDKGDYGLNQGIWTVMSYNSGWDQAPGVNAYGSGPSYGWAGTLMAFDIAALQYLYGVNNTYKTGDDDYALPTANTKGTFWSCIWDAGGIDTISNEGNSGAAIINLNDAPLIGPNAGGYVSRVAGIKGGFTIANGAMVENGIGGDGNDYIVGNEFDNVLDGGIGIDTVSYELATANVTVDLNIQDGVTQQDTVGAGKDTLSGFENLVGSGFDDTLAGDGNANKIDAGAGADFVTGGAKNDALDGGAGIDTLDYGYLTAGNDLVVTLGAFTKSSGAVAQTLTSGVAGDIDTIRNFENVTGGQGNDKFTGNTGINILSGGDGDDLLTGGLGSDTIDGGSEGPLGDTASFAGITSAITASLTSGDGTATYKNGLVVETDDLFDIENLIGGSGTDKLTGDIADNFIEGGLGNDTLDGDAEGAGGDTVSFASATAAVTFSLAAQSNLIAQKTGGAGTDIIFNFENILGGKSNDKLTGDANKNKIDGGAGNDLIEGDDDADRLFGGFGIDTISYALSMIAVVIFLLEQGTFDINGDAIDGTAQTGGHANGDLLWGFENVTGSASDDTLEGDGFANTILGGAGGDIISGRGGKDILDGGVGIDTVDFSYLGAGQNLVLTLGALTVSTGVVAKTSTSGIAGDVDGVANFENAVGGDGNDKLTGNAGANTIEGGGGDDRLSGMAGNDTLDGGDGNDVLEGGAGDDTLDGGADSDTASYATATVGVSVDLTQQGAAQNTVGAGNDTLNDIENLIGSKKNDTLTGDGNDNTIEGGLGDDTLSGGANTAAGDTLSYAAATAAVTFNLALQGGQQSTGGGGKDTATGFENLIGGKGNDKLTGDAAANIIKGGAGNDTINAGDGSDTIIIAGAEAVGDIINGGADTDTIEVTGTLALTLANFNAGTAGIETWLGNGKGIIGTTAANVLDFSALTTVSGILSVDGGSGNDTITGTLEDDLIFGGTGNDIIQGGAGQDEMHGGAGVDTLSYEASSVGVTVSIGGGFGDVVGGAGGDAAFDSGTGFENIIGGSGNDGFDGNSLANVIDGRGGNDDLWGFAGADKLIGGAGDDTLHGNDGADTLTGGDDNDILEGGAAADKLAGGDGIDTADYSGSGLGITIDLTKATAQKGGDAAGDLLSGIENIIGSVQSDKITGDANNNRIEGGAEDDTLDGGLGNDTFVYADTVGQDQIYNFQGGAGAGDIIEIDAALTTEFNDFAEFQAAWSEFPSIGVFINLGGGETILIRNQVIADLHQDDFILTF